MFLTGKADAEAAWHCWEGFESVKWVCCCGLSQSVESRPRLYTIVASTVSVISDMTSLFLRGGRLKIDSLTQIYPWRLFPMDFEQCISYIQTSGARWKKCRLWPAQATDLARTDSGPFFSTNIRESPENNFHVLPRPGLDITWSHSPRRFSFGKWLPKHFVIAKFSPAAEHPNDSSSKLWDVVGCREGWDCAPLKVHIEAKGFEMRTVLGKIIRASIDSRSACRGTLMWGTRSTLQNSAMWRQSASVSVEVGQCCLTSKRSKP